MNTPYGCDIPSRLLGVLHPGGALPGNTSYSYSAAGTRLRLECRLEAGATPQNNAHTSGTAIFLCHEEPTRWLRGTVGHSYRRRDHR